MPKAEMLEVHGKVLEVLPTGMYRVQLETGRIIFAYECGKLRLHHIRILKGDTVLVEVSPYDLKRGRISCCIKHETA